MDPGNDVCKSLLHAAIVLVRGRQQLIPFAPGPIAEIRPLFLALGSSASVVLLDLALCSGRRREVLYQQLLQTGDFDFLRCQSCLALSKLFGDPLDFVDGCRLIERSLTELAWCFFDHKSVV